MQREPLSDRDDVVAQLGLSPSQTSDLDRFHTMLTEANAQMNLVAAGSLSEFWRRHVLDSAQLLSHAPEARVWADLGAGAGFPGLVLAILLKGEAGTQVHLVESQAKKCRFLGAVVSALDLPAHVHNARAESLKLKVEIVTARACAPLIRLLGYAAPFLQRGAKAVFLKGESIADEIAVARKSWGFDAVTRPSLSDPRGRILLLSQVSRGC